MPFIKNPGQKNISRPIDVQSTFVGRLDEIHFFLEKILLPEEPIYNIISVFGQGGVGKSTLLYNFDRETRKDLLKDFCSAGWVNERYTDPISVMERFISQLDIDNEFNKVNSKLKGKIREIQVLQRTKREETLRKIATESISAVSSDIPIVGKLLERESTSAIGYLFDEINYRHLLKDTELMEDPVDELTKAFLNDLNSLALIKTITSQEKLKRNRRIILFFDSFEQTASVLAPWLLNYVLPSNISNNIVIVVAGRDPLNRSLPDDPKQWLSYYDDNIVYSISLENFTKAETELYLSQRHITDGNRVAKIWNLSQGLPLYLSLLTSHPYGEIDPTADVVANFLRWIPKEEGVKRQIALDAALLSRPFDLDDLRVFSYLPENADEIYQWLIKLPFIRSYMQEGRHVYHDVVQEIFTRHIYNSSLVEYYNKRRVIAAHYRALLEKLMEEELEDYISIERQEIVLALAFQLCFLPDRANHVAAVELILNIHRKMKDFSEPLGTLQNFFRDNENLIKDEEKEILIYLIKYLKFSKKMFLTSSELDTVNFFLEKMHENTPFSPIALADFYYSRGRNYISLRMVSQALEDFNSAIAHNPQHGNALLARGGIYRKAGSLEKALADFDAAVKSDVRHHHLGEELKGEIYLRLGNTDMAIEAFKRAIMADPVCTEGWESLLKIYEKLYPKEKLPELVKDIPLPSAFLDLGVINRARKIAELGLIEDAMSDLEEALRINPENSVIFLVRGQINLKRQAYQLALADFDKAVELMPHDAEVRINRGKCYGELGMNEKALADFDSVIHMASSSKPLVRDLGERYGSVHIAVTRHGIIRPFISSLEAFFHRAITYRNVMRFEEAIYDLSRILEIDLDNAEAMFERGRTYEFMKEFHKALNDYDNAIKINGNYKHIAQKSKARIYVALNDYDNAILAFHKALKASMACEHCWKELAKLYLTKHPSDQTAILLREIKVPSRNRANIIICRSRAMREVGLYQSAIEDLNLIIERNPNNKRALIERGENFIELSLYNRALEDFNNVIALGGLAMISSKKLDVVLINSKSTKNNN